MLLHLSVEPFESEVVQIGAFEFVDKDNEPRDVDVDDLTNTEMTRLGQNGRTKNTLMNDLCSKECDKVFSCSTTKEIWVTWELC